MALGHPITILPASSFSNVCEPKYDRPYALVAGANRYKQIRRCRSCGVHGNAPWTVPSENNTTSPALVTGCCMNGRYSSLPSTIPGGIWKFDLCDPGTTQKPPSPAL